MVECFGLRRYSGPPQPITRSHKGPFGGLLIVLRTLDRCPTYSYVRHIKNVLFHCFFFSQFAIFWALLVLEILCFRQTFCFQMAYKFLHPVIKVINDLSGDLTGVLLTRDRCQLNRLMGVYNTLKEHFFTPFVIFLDLPYLGRYLS